MKEIFNDYSEAYIKNKAPKKVSHCVRCLNENRSDASLKKVLYEYEWLGKNIDICEEHIACLEIVREMREHRKPMNDIEKMRYKKELKGLIEEGQKLMI